MTQPTSFTPEQLSTAEQVLQTAQASGATMTQQMALMEAGLVESGMRNLSYGDLDSVGVFQERPSQGWQNPMNIQAATQQLLAHMNTKLTDPGAMAQSAERSAFPDRYNQMQPQAQALLAQADAALGVSPGSTGNVASLASSGGGLLTGGITDFIQQWAARASLIVFGAVIMLLGVWLTMGHKTSDIIKAGGKGGK